MQSAVIEVLDGIVHSVHLCKTNDEGKELFKQICMETVPRTWNAWSEEDWEDAISEGYMLYANNSICLSLDL